MCSASERPGNTANESAMNIGKGRRIVIGLRIQKANGRMSNVPKYTLDE